MKFELQKLVMHIPQAFCLNFGLPIYIATKKKFTIHCHTNVIHHHILLNVIHL